MTKKSTRDSRLGLPPGADDFQRIDGIGPGIERRLHGAGVLTYAQLGERAPESLLPLVANIIGMTADVIAEQDWPGQARELAREQSARPGGFDENMQASRAQAERDEPYRSRYTTFTVELLLDDERMVRRTRIKHVQGEHEDSWPGWQIARLNDFIARYAELRPNPDERVAFPIETPPRATEHRDDIVAPTEEIPVALAEHGQPVGVPHTHASGLAGALALGEAELFIGDLEASHQLIVVGQPFQVRLALDLSAVDRPAGAVLLYEATLAAKQLGTGRRIRLGQASGTLPPGERAELQIAGQALERGIYRMETAVTLALAAPPAAAPSTLGALREGGVLQVY